MTTETTMVAGWCALCGTSFVGEHVCPQLNPSTLRSELAALRQRIIALEAEKERWRKQQLITARDNIELYGMYKQVRDERDATRRSVSFWKRKAVLRGITLHMALRARGIARFARWYRISNRIEALKS